MARHNREGRGADQRGKEYIVSYQPDWLRLVKVSRALEHGRQSTLTLFRNPSAWREGAPGDRVRTRITSPEQGLDVEVVVNDPNAAVRCVRVSCLVPGEGTEGTQEEVMLTLVNGLQDRTGTP